MLGYPAVQAAIDLADYKGGENPLVLFVIIFTLSLLPLLALLYYFLAGYRVNQVNRFCQQLGLSSGEKGHLKGFFRRLHIRHPLLVMTEIRYLDAFMNRVARYYMGMGLTEEELIREIDVFGNVRLKLNLRHSFKNKRILSSRSLPPKHPIEVTYTDEETNQSFTFLTSVVYNSELFLGIAPPVDNKGNPLKVLTRADLEISFQREKGYTYSFESRYVRSVNFPLSMWYLLHSSQLTRADHARNLRIKASILVCGNERVDEDSVASDMDREEVYCIISVLNNKGCVLEIAESDSCLNAHDQMLISFELEEERHLSLRATVVQTYSKPGKQLVKADFKNLSSEENKYLFSFYIRQKKKEKEDMQTRRKAVH